MKYENPSTVTKHQMTFDADDIRHGLDLLMGKLAGTHPAGLPKDVKIRLLVPHGGDCSGEWLDLAELESGLVVTWETIE